MSTKRATKKAIENWCDINNIDDEKIYSIINVTYPHVYIQSDELTSFVIKALFKEYDIISNESEIVSVIQNLHKENSIRRFSVEYKECERNENALRNILSKIMEDVKHGEVRASKYPEWNNELKEFIKSQYGHWSIYDDRGKIAYGKAFNKFFSYWFFDRNNPSFHCYATQNGDVLFTKKRYNWVAKLGCYDFELVSDKHRSYTRQNIEHVETDGMSVGAIIVLAVIAIATLFKVILM